MALTYPPALHPGDTIAVIAPASAPEPERLTAGIQALEAEGFHVHQIRPSIEPFGYLAGPDEVRVNEFHAALLLGEVRALFCARGGYGTLRLLQRLDYVLARERPKLVVGYSDITALQLALLHNANLPSISGPMVATDWPELTDEEKALLRALMEGQAPLELALPDHAPTTVFPGKATGTLLGGNLHLLTRLVGTPFLPRLRDVILFIEDIHIKPYQLDGMLLHLELSGFIRDVRGILFGQFTDSEPDPDKPSFSIEEVIDYYIRRWRIPAAMNVPYGHVAPKIPLPNGGKVELVAEKEQVRITLLEPIVTEG